MQTKYYITVRFRFRFTQPSEMPIWTNPAARLSNIPNCQGTHKIQKGHQLVNRQLKNRNHSSFHKIIPPKIFINSRVLERKSWKIKRKQAALRTHITGRGEGDHERAGGGAVGQGVAETPAVPTEAEVAGEHQRRRRGRRRRRWRRRRRHCGCC